MYGLIVSALSKAAPWKNSTLEIVPSESEALADNVRVAGGGGGEIFLGGGGGGGGGGGWGGVGWGRKFEDGRGSGVCRKSYGARACTGTTSSAPAGESGTACRRGSESDARA